MLLRCQTGACEYISGESKENIENIDISEVNGNIERVEIRWFSREYSLC